MSTVCVYRTLSWNWQRFRVRVKAATDHFMIETECMHACHMSHRHVSDGAKKRCIGRNKMAAATPGCPRVYRRGSCSRSYRAVIARWCVYWLVLLDSVCQTGLRRRQPDRTNKLYCICIRI